MASKIKKFRPSFLHLTLSSETMFSPSQPTDTLNVHLTDEDLNSLKQIKDLSTGLTNSYLTFGDNTFQANETDSDGTLLSNRIRLPGFHVQVAYTTKLGWLRCC